MLGAVVARVMVVSGGYRGDVLPFVPIARELVRLGHDVRVVVPSDFAELLADEPFDVPPADGHEMGPSYLEQFAPFMARWGKRLGGARVPRLMLRLLADQLEAVIAAVEPHVKWADVMVTHPIAGLATAISAEQHGTPWVVGDLFPMLLPSGAEPPMGVANLGPALNRASWRMARSPLLDRISHADAFKAARQARGLDTQDWNLVDARTSPLLTLGLASRHYVDAQPDWPAGYDLVGFTYWDAPPGYMLPDEITRFMDDGEPPVAVTLGTSAASALPEVFRQVAAALDEVGERGLFLVSTPENREQLRAALGDRHGVWAFAPLDRVLPRCKAIVHSGAHGTNALALRAGLPSVIRPCLQDQVWHAERQVTLGTGVHVRRNQFRPALERALGDGSIRDGATAMAQAISDETGAATAAARITAVV